MRLNITADDASQRPDQLVDLSWIRTSHCIGYSDPVDANLVHCPVNGQQVDELGSERIFRRESDLDSLGFDKVYHLDRAGRTISRLSTTARCKCLREEGQETHVLVIHVMSFPCE